ncbi:rhodanese-like domain-containing protein [Methylocystis echinoides]|uniref:Rhodanese domain-containing protein n=1 Tax=Methylocystis echinoides TaxID=29468 RepID=A0A9W6LU34_9HYPH|nr:rhodanese-like domain-containing protein [Methylocystis echinoides]GLI95243.1 hypothetical protein LMG27198_42350 [Methylocystis echinoides]
MRSYFDHRDRLEPTRAELAERLRAGTVTVLDVRPEDEFALGHAPGAALRGLKARLSEFDAVKEIVADCRGAFCILSYEAVAGLRAMVFRTN